MSDFLNPCLVILIFKSYASSFKKLYMRKFDLKSPKAYHTFKSIKKQNIGCFLKATTKI